MSKTAETKIIMFTKLTPSIVVLSKHLIRIHQQCLHNFQFFYLFKLIVLVYEIISTPIVSLYIKSKAV